MFDALIILGIKIMKNKIFYGRKLTEYEKKVLHLISDSSESNYILEVIDVNTGEIRYTITNGEDDFQDVRVSTMKKLKLFYFLRSKYLPSCDRIIRAKYFIPERFRSEVFSACL
jgi:hypothetical protein